jgi:peptidoglycan/LPS O-acetylase OafA/YrhL
LPTVRGSATAATLIHLISYFAVFALKDPDIAAGVKVGMSIFPNIGMTFCIYNLYNSEANQGGLQFSNASQWYNNSSYLSSLIMLIIDSGLLLCIGLYLD